MKKVHPEIIRTLLSEASTMYFSYGLHGEYYLSGGYNHIIYFHKDVVDQDGLKEANIIKYDEGSTVELLYTRLVESVFPVKKQTHLIGFDPLSSVLEEQNLSEFNLGGRVVSLDTFLVLMRAMAHLDYYQVYCHSEINPGELNTDHLHFTFEKETGKAGVVMFSRLARRFDDLFKLGINKVHNDEHKNAPEQS